MELCSPVKAATLAAAVTRTASQDHCRKIGVFAKAALSNGDGDKRNRARSCLWDRPVGFESLSRRQNQIQPISRLEQAATHDVVYNDFMIRLQELNLGPVHSTSNGDKRPN